ncbi:MAG: TrmB family transcriptional regulator [Halohasta sp.]
MPTLRDLGLSEYEDRAYRSLLQTAPTTAKELSRTSEVPMGRIYDVLNSLEQHSLVRSQASGRPKKYVAVEPEIALDRLLEAKQRELDEQAERYAEIVETLAEEIDTGESVDEQFWTAAVGPEETLELLLERISTAEEELIHVAGSPASGIDLRTVTDRVADALEQALERGVDIELLVTPSLVSDLPSHSVEQYYTSLVQYENFEVRTVDGVDGSFALLDGVEVCIEVPNPLDPTEPFAMIDLKDVSFATDIREEFLPRWERADSFEPPQD